MKNTEIFGGVEAVDLCLYLSESGTLVLADLHLGYEEMMNEEGVMIPRFNCYEIKTRLSKVFFDLQANRKEVTKIVVNGDLKHEFAKISGQEWKEVLEILGFLQAQCKEIVLIKGNHDTILGPIAEKKEVKVLEEGLFLPEEKIFICHGDKILESEEFQQAETLIIAHEHPAVALREGVKSELYKCFLKGKWQNKTLIVLPSLNTVSIGSNVLREKILSPFLKQDLTDFDVWVVEDKPYFFGKLGELE